MWSEWRKLAWCFSWARNEWVNWVSNIGKCWSLIIFSTNNHWGIDWVWWEWVGRKGIRIEWVGMKGDWMRCRGQKHHVPPSQGLLLLFQLFLVQFFPVCVTRPCNRISEISQIHKPPQKLVVWSCVKITANSRKRDEWTDIQKSENPKLELKRKDH